jgi:hypothetical protein
VLEDVFWGTIKFFFEGGNKGLVLSSSIRSTKEVAKGTSIER